MAMLHQGPNVATEYVALLLQILNVPASDPGPLVFMIVVFRDIPQSFQLSAGRVANLK